MAKRIIAFRPSDWAATLESLRALAPDRISAPIPQVGDEWHVEIEGALVPGGPSPARVEIETSAQPDGAVSRVYRITPAA